MIIVVEGPDNSGKTTLAHRLAKDLGGIFLKTNVRPVNDQVLARFTDVARTIEAAFGVLVLDRHHAISEPIYGMILRGFHNINLWEANLHCRGLHVIYCRRTVTQLSDFLDGIPQLEGVKENIAAIHRQYEELFRKKFTPFASVTMYDWAETSYPILLSDMRLRKELSLK